MPRKWTRLDREDSHAIIDGISSHRDAVLFSKETTEVVTRPLPFYSGFDLYRLTNYATMPVFTLMYLYNGEIFIPLDGTANPIYTANEQDPITLTEDNVIDYLDFFFENVQGSEGDVFLVRDPRKMPFMLSLAEDVRKKVVEVFRPLKALTGPPLTVTGTIWYGGALIGATITADAQGKLAFQEQKMLLTNIQFPPGPIGARDAWLDEGTYDDATTKAG